MSLWISTGHPENSTQQVSNFSMGMKEWEFNGEMANLNGQNGTSRSLIKFYSDTGESTLSTETNVNTASGIFG